MRSIRLTAATAMIFPLLFASLVSAGGHCKHCGCDQGCNKVCRLVSEEKKVTIVCWGCKCEDFCLPGPSERGCLNRDCVCDEDLDDPKSPCVHAKPFVWYDWTPACKSCVYDKKKLMKKTIEKKIPWYKWEVEEVCCDCERKCPCAQIVPGANIPDPPAVAVKLIYGRDGETIIEDRSLRGTPVLNVARQSSSTWALPAVFTKSAKTAEEPQIRVLR